MRPRWTLTNNQCVLPLSWISFISTDLLCIQTGGFETPADNGTLTNFAEMSQARDKILSLKLDQVG